MLNFLKEYGISDSVIIEIEKVNINTNIYNLNCNQYEVGKIIKFLKEHGVRNVDQLLVNKIDLFFYKYEYLKSLFYKYDLYKLVELINQDYNIVDML